MNKLHPVVLGHKTRRVIMDTALAFHTESNMTQQDRILSAIRLVMTGADVAGLTFDSDLTFNFGVGGKTHSFVIRKPAFDLKFNATPFDQGKLSLFAERVSDAIDEAGFPYTSADDLVKSGLYMFLRLSEDTESPLNGGTGAMEFSFTMDGGKEQYLATLTFDAVGQNAAANFEEDPT